MATSSAVCKSDVLIATLGSEEFQRILGGCLGERRLRELFSNSL